MRGEGGVFLNMGERGRGEAKVVLRGDVLGRWGGCSWEDERRECGENLGVFLGRGGWKGGGGGGRAERKEKGRG